LLNSSYKITENNKIETEIRVVKLSTTEIAVICPENTNIYVYLQIYLVATGRQSVLCVVQHSCYTPDRMQRSGKLERYRAVLYKMHATR